MGRQVNIRFPLWNQNLNSKFPTTGGPTKEVEDAGGDDFQRQVFKMFMQLLQWPLSGGFEKGVAKQREQPRDIRHRARIDAILSECKAIQVEPSVLSR